MATSNDYRLGSIWLIRFDPLIGSEIQKTRPEIIVSATASNQHSRVTVLPITLVKRLGQIEVEQIQQIKQILAAYLDLESPE